MTRLAGLVSLAAFLAVASCGPSAADLGRAITAPVAGLPVPRAATFRGGGSQPEEATYTLPSQDFQATTQWYLTRLGRPGSAWGTWQGCTHDVVHVPYPYEGWEWAMNNSDDEYTSLQLSVELVENMTEVDIVSQMGAGQIALPC